MPLKDDFRILYIGYLMRGGSAKIRAAGKA